MTDHSLLYRADDPLSNSVLFILVSLIILTVGSQRAPLALRPTRVADSPAVFDEVEMEAVIKARGDERGEEIVRLLHARLFRNPAEPARDAKDVGVDGKGGRYG